MSGVEGIMLDIIFVLENMAMVCGIFCIPFSKNRKFFVGGILLAILCIADICIGYGHLMTMILRVCFPPIIVILWTDGKMFRRFAIYICSIMYLHMPYLCIDLIFLEFLENQ